MLDLYLYSRVHACPGILMSVKKSKVSFYVAGTLNIVVHLNRRPVIMILNKDFIIFAQLFQTEETIKIINLIRS